MNEIYVRQNRVLLRPDGVLHVVGTGRERQTLATAQAILAAMRQLSPGRRRPLLLDLTLTGPLDADARDHYNAAGPAVVTALAIVTTSTVGRIIANFLMARNEGVLPVRLFNDEPAALDWLHAHAVAA